MNSITFLCVGKTELFYQKPFMAVPSLQAEIDKELQRINEDVQNFKIFPVLQLGLSYRFELHPATD